MKKKYIILSLCFLLIISTSENVKAEKINGINKEDTIDLDFNNSDVEISDVMTYEEVIEEMMDNKNISREKAIEILGPKTKSTLTYRTIGKLIDVSRTYKPKLTFYCQTEEGYYDSYIVKIINTDLNRKYGEYTRQFEGAIFSYLETSSRIYFVLNGDFYYNTTQTNEHEYNINIGVGESKSVGFSVRNSSSSNHYKYHREEGYIYY